MRFRSMTFLLVLALTVLFTASHVGAAEEESTTPPAEPEVVALEAETFETSPAEAPLDEFAPVADPFLDQSLINITPVHVVYCPCQVGVSCCGDPGVDIQCGNRRYCVCNGQNDCVLQHVHPPK